MSTSHPFHSFIHPAFYGFAIPKQNRCCAQLSTYAGLWLTKHVSTVSTLSFHTYHYHNDYDTSAIMQHGPWCIRHHRCPKASTTEASISSQSTLRWPPRPLMVCFDEAILTMVLSLATSRSHDTHARHASTYAYQYLTHFDSVYIHYNKQFF